MYLKFPTSDILNENKEKMSQNLSSAAYVIAPIKLQNNFDWGNFYQFLILFGSVSALHCSYVKQNLTSLFISFMIYYL